MIPQFLLFSLQLDITLWVVFGNKYKLHHLLLLFFLWLALIVNVKYFTIFFWFSWDLGAHSIYIHCPFCHHNQTNVSNSTLFDLTSKGRAVLHKHINFYIITSQIYVIYPKQFSIISSHILHYISYHHVSVTIIHKQPLSPLVSLECCISCFSLLFVCFHCFLTFK